jgi:toxin YoeB
MGKFRVEIKIEAQKDLKRHFKSGDKATIKRIEVILKELEIHPYIGTGQPEQLKYELTGKWSRRINQKDRMIYEVHEDVVTVDVLSAMGDYSDK